MPGCITPLEGNYVQECPPPSTELPPPFVQVRPSLEFTCTETTATYHNTGDLAVFFTFAGEQVTVLSGSTVARSAVAVEDGSAGYLVDVNGDPVQVGGCVTAPEAPAEVLTVAEVVQTAAPLPELPATGSYAAQATVFGSVLLITGAILLGIKRLCRAQ